MGSHCSFLKSSKKKADVVPTQKVGQFQSTKDLSRQDIDPQMSINPENFHAHQRDFIRKQSTAFGTYYEMKEEIGSGGFGKVRKTIDLRTNQFRAVKIIPKKTLAEKNSQKLMKEVRVLLDLDHPNIVKIYDVFEDLTKYYIVSELLTGGELFDRIIEKKHLTEQDAAKIMQQVLAAIAYCHRLGVAHRDLKPENILFDSKNDYTVKIIDFGLAQTFKPLEKMTGIKGTAYYIAPEVLRSAYNEKCDVWSCGVILYIMLSGYPPFNGDTDEQIFSAILRGTYNFNDPVWANVSNEAKLLIQKMMMINPNKRISAEEALEDRWFKQSIHQSLINKPIAQEALNRLSNYRTTTKLQEAAWVFLVSYFSTKEENKQLWNTFKSLDLNGDGQLTKEEIITGYVKIMGMSYEMAQEEAEKIFNSLDVNHDGRIDYSEFVSACTSRKMILTKDKLETAFKIFDRNGDGKITAEEIKHVFNDEKIKNYPLEFWQKLVSQVDQNKDGVISLEEFKYMMLSLYNEDPAFVSKNYRS